MEELSALWRVRGSLAVPVESDDGGLVSRMGDVFIGADTDLIEERDDYLLFDAPKYFLRLPIQGAEFRREGIKGWRFIRYDYPVIQMLPGIVLHGIVFGGLLGQALVWAGLPPYAYLTALLMMLLLYWMNHRGTHMSVKAGLRRAFAV
jgi:hypothetical protein